MSGHAERETKDVLSEFRAIFRAWEWLRIPYNLVLAGVVLWMAAPSFAWLPHWIFWIVLGECMLAANLAYFAGPAIEVYACWLGVRSRLFRFSLWFAGTLFAALLAYGLISNNFFFPVIA